MANPTMAAPVNTSTPPKKSGRTTSSDHKEQTRVKCTRAATTCHDCQVLHKNDTSASCRHSKRWKSSKKGKLLSALEQRIASLESEVSPPISVSSQDNEPTPTVGPRIINVALSPLIIEIVLQTYFLFVHPWIPIVNESRIRQELTDENLHPRLAPLILSMALVTRNSLDHESAMMLDELIQHQEIFCRDMINNAFDTPSVHSATCLVILSFHQIGNGHLSQVLPLLEPLSSMTNQPPAWKLQGEYNMNFQDESESKEYQCIIAAIGRLRLLHGLFTTPFANFLHDSPQALLDRYSTTHESQVITETDGSGTDAFLLDPDFVPDINYLEPNLIDNFLLQSINTPPSQWVDLSSLKRNSPGLCDGLASAGGHRDYTASLESLSRVIAYLYKQDTQNQLKDEFDDIAFDLAQKDFLLHQEWKLYLTEKPYEANPHWIMAFVTLSCASILLHQQRIIPPENLDISSHLESKVPGDSTYGSHLLRKESCERCATLPVKMAVTVQDYLKSLPPDAPIAGIVGFCLYIAARVLLVQWGFGLMYELAPEFWSIVWTLEDMARRWSGNASHPSANDSLAGKCAEKLKELHVRVLQDPSFTSTISQNLESLLF